MGTQEEALCRESTLFSGLEALMDQGKYPIPHEGYALVEGVLVYRHPDFSLRDTPFYCDVIASDMGNLEGVGQASLSALSKANWTLCSTRFLSEEARRRWCLEYGAAGRWAVAPSIRRQWRDCL